MLLLAGGTGAPGQRRDEARYRTESEYMQGWNDGFSACCRRGAISVQPAAFSSLLTADR